MKAYLPLFLEELPKQTIFDDIQVVLDHNEPSAEELVWVKDFQAKYPGRLKHIVVDKVDPIGVSMNRCIKEADADLVAIWNVDDLRTPDSFEKQVQGFSDHPRSGVIHGNFVIVGSFGSKSGKYVDHVPYTYADTPVELTRSMVLGPFFGFRKSLCDSCGYFDEQLRSGADFDLAIRLAMWSQVDMAQGVLGYYLDEGKGASTKGDGRQPMERTAIEMRYGLDDKVDHRFVPGVKASGIDVDSIVQFGEKVNVTDLLRKLG